MSRLTMVGASVTGAPAAPQARAEPSSRLRRAVRALRGPLNADVVDRRKLVQYFRA